MKLGGVFFVVVVLLIPQVCTEDLLCVNQGLFEAPDYSCEPSRQELCFEGICILLGVSKQMWA